MVHLSCEHFSYPSDERWNITDTRVYSVHCKLTSNRLWQLAKHEAVKKKSEATLIKISREDTLVPTKFKNHRTASLEILKDFESRWDGHLGCVKVALHQSDLLNKDVKPVYPADVRQKQPPGNSPRQKLAEWSPWRCLNKWLPNCRPRLCLHPSCLALFAFASTISNRTSSPSVIRTPFHAWTSESIV